MQPSLPHKVPFSLSKPLQCLEVQEEFISDGKERNLPSLQPPDVPSPRLAGLHSGQGQAELLLLLSGPSQLHLSAVTSAFSELSSSQELHLLLPTLPSSLNNAPKKGLWALMPP